MDLTNQRQKYDVGKLLNEYQGVLNQKYSLSFVQDKAVKDLIKCRTAQNGGHTRQCTNCGHQEQGYNSCRNRHCPKCQFTKQVQWVDKLKSVLPSVRYYHIVFTIPQALHRLFNINQRVCYDLLLKLAGTALKQVVNSKYTPPIDIGAILILHTWGQALTYHPHVHMLVPAGGLSEDRMEWIHTNKKFFVPVKVLSRVFRGLFCKSIEKAINSGDMHLPESCEWTDLRDQLYHKDWNVYIKPALSGPEHVLEYLGRYTHRVAIANERITSVDSEKVFFRIKDYRSKAMIKTMNLPVIEFLRRFLQHVLPGGFYKIRYIGFLAHNVIGELGQHVLALLEQTPNIPEFEGLSALQVFDALAKSNPWECLVCGTGRLIPSHLIIPPS